MALLGIILFLFCFNKITCNCVLNHTTSSNSFEGQLRKFVIKQSLKPNITNEIVNITITFVLKYFKYDDVEEVFSAHNWIYTSFVDQRLRWNPEEYDGIKGITISKSFLGLPRLKVINSIDSYDSSYSCQIRSSGYVICVPTILHEIHCPAYLRNWPYDTQKCTLQYGSSGKIKTILKASSNPVLIGEARHSANWHLIKTNHTQSDKCCDSSKFEINFFLKREGTVAAAVFLFPNFIVSSLNFVSLFLKGNLRLIIISYSLLNHFYFLCDFSYISPSRGADTPLLLMYCRTSTMWTGFLVFLTFILERLSKKNISPPYWIVFVNEQVFNRYGFLVLPRWTVDSTEDTKHLEQWTNFANLLNTVFIVITLIVYLILYFVYIPSR